MKNHEKPWKTNLEPWKTMKNQPGTMKNHSQVKNSFEKCLFNNHFCDRQLLLYINHYQPHHHCHHQHHDFVDHVCLRWVCEALDLIRVNYCQQKCLLSINLYSHAQPIISFLSDRRLIIAWPSHQLIPVVETWWIWLWLKTSCCWCWYWEKNCQRVDDSCHFGNNLTKTLHSSTTVWNFLL